LFWDEQDGLQKSVLFWLIHFIILFAEFVSLNVVNALVEPQYPFYTLTSTEQGGLTDNASDFYSVGTRFEYWPGHGLLMAFLIISRQMPG
jgi:hypothetical protein